MKALKRIPAGIWCLLILGCIFGYLGKVMGTANMLNTIMFTAHDLLINTCFYLMSICVIMGALSRILTDFGVVDLLEKMLRPLMKPLFNLPGAASLGAVMTFLSDNPAIITLANDKSFSRYFKKYQFISLNNFGTAFGMGMIVMVFMFGQGFTYEPVIGFIGAIVGCIVSTRLMQRSVLKKYPQYLDEDVVPSGEIFVEDKVDPHQGKSTFVKILNCLLDGGRTGVEIGLAIIPGVLIVSTLVMILTFGAGEGGIYTGAAYEGTELLPWVADKLSFLFNALFGFKDPHLIAFPITALGAVGAALGIIPNFISQGWIDGNAIAVFTAIGMCWSGFFSTHTAMMDSLGCRELTTKAIGAHAIGGICAGVAAHWIFVLVSLI